MPAADCFVDTNILLYAIGTEASEADKTAIAKSLLLTTDWVWSAQVAAEFIVASTSKKRAKPQTLFEATQFINAWLHYKMVAITPQVILDALVIADRYRISYFDAQILAAAKQSSCTTLYSEDLNHGQVYDGVRVQNPFLVPTSTP